MSTTVAVTKPNYQFDDATNTTYVGKTDTNSHIFKGSASIKWAIGDVPNGGYVMGIIIDSVIRHFSDKYQTDPVALNCFFFGKTLPGNLIVEIDDLKVSKKGYYVVRATLKQRKDLSALANIEEYNASEWIEKVHGIFTMGNMGNEQGLTYPYKTLERPPLDKLKPYNYMFMGEYLNCTIDASAFPANEETAGKPEVTQTMSFKDGRPIDFKSIPYWCDMFITPPTLLGPAVLVDGPIWCPTMQLEVQFKRKPTKSLITAHFITRDIKNGRFEVDGEIWNEDGELLAITRHQNLVVPWSRNSKDAAKTKARTLGLMENAKL